MDASPQGPLFDTVIRAHVRGDLFDWDPGNLASLFRYPLSPAAGEAIREVSWTEISPFPKTAHELTVVVRHRAGDTDEATEQAGRRIRNHTVAHGRVLGFRFLEATSTALGGPSSGAEAGVAPWGNLYDGVLLIPVSRSTVWDVPDVAVVMGEVSRVLQGDPSGGGMMVRDVQAPFRWRLTEASPYVAVLQVNFSAWAADSAAALNVGEAERRLAEWCGDPSAAPMRHFGGDVSVGDARGRVTERTGEPTPPPRGVVPAPPDGPWQIVTGQHRGIVRPGGPPDPGDFRR